MKIYNQGINDFNKKTIYLDIDDVVLESAETVIDILNEQRILNGQAEKEYNELKDWTYKSILRDITCKDLVEIFNSNYFWENVKVNKNLLLALENNNEELFNKFNWIFTTKGNLENQEKKFKYIFNVPFFKKHKKEIGYYGIDMNEDKSIIHMFNGIQVDDNYNNLKASDAEVKILLTNDRETDYNSVYHIRDNLQNLYIAFNMQEVIDAINFFTNNTEFKNLETVEENY